MSCPNQKIKLIGNMIEQNLEHNYENYIMTFQDNIYMYTVMRRTTFKNTCIHCIMELTFMVKIKGGNHLRFNLGVLVIKF